MDVIIYWCVFWFFVITHAAVYGLGRVVGYEIGITVSRIKAAITEDDQEVAPDAPHPTEDERDE